MNKKFSFMALALLAFLTLSTILSVMPMTKGATEYTEITGALGDAPYTIRIPSPIENWNRDLVLFCRGYDHNKPSNPMGGTMGSYENFSQAVLARGAAFAATTYGSGGYCVQKGMNTTHELAQYVKSTFNATGKTYLMGVSMGGNIVLMLGQKYPNAYSGVLDICGAKNLTVGYDGAVFMSTANDSQMDARIQALTSPVPPYPFSLFGSSWRTIYRNWCAQLVVDMETEFGGNPTAVPQAYRDSDPLYHANISIPVITVQGTSDALVPYARTLEYQAAVNAAGKSSLYRMYSILGGQHGDAPVMNDALNRLGELMAWSNTLTGNITLTPKAQAPGASVFVEGASFGETKAVGIGLGAEVNVINETMGITGPVGVGLGPYIGVTSHFPIKPGTFRMSVNVSSTLYVAVSPDLGNGSLGDPFSMFINGTINYVTGEYTRFTKSPVSATNHYVHLVNYTYYQYNATPAAGVTTNSSGAFTTPITLPGVANGSYTITAIDTQGHIATANLTVNTTIPESFSIGATLALSLIAVVAGLRYFRKPQRITK